jgi:hypothetical protein
MGFQNKAGSIILDATLTDVGRRHASQGKLKITKFSLGDDEIDYTLGNRSSGEFLLDNAPPTLEAPAVDTSAIIHGLIDYNRADILLLPHHKLNINLKNAVREYNNIIYLSVNDETTKKLATAFDNNLYLLESDKVIENVLLFESGIEYNTTKGTQETQERFIHNLDLHDRYYFVYIDSRFFEGLLSTSTTATEVSTDAAGNEKSDFQALTQVKSISLTAPTANYDTYYCTSVMNNIYDLSDGAPLSAFSGPRSCFLPLNFIVNQKMKSKSNGTADVRYTKFGETAQNVFSDGNLYDYVDTNIMIEGTSTIRTHQARIRIIRFSGT